MGALDKATAIFRASEKKHKLLFTITDGEFHDTEESVHSQMQALDALEVRSHLVYILPENSRYSSPAESEQKKMELISQLKLGPYSNRSHQQATVAIGVGPASKALRDDILQVVQEAAANAIV